MKNKSSSQKQNQTNERSPKQSRAAGSKGAAIAPPTYRRDDFGSQSQEPISNQVQSPAAQASTTWAGSDGTFSPGLIVQAKLTVGPVHDKYEQEADQVAAQVVRRLALAAPPPALNPANSGRTRTGGTVQTKTMDRSQVGAAGGDLSPETTAAIQRAKGSGQPLGAKVRSKMEGAFGADFSRVRLHTGSQADQLNRTIQAKAFTQGRDIFFRRGAYNPAAASGQHLLAHELTHTLQQGAVESPTTPIRRIEESKSDDIRVKDQPLTPTRNEPIRRHWLKPHGVPDVQRAIPDNLAIGAPRYTMNGNMRVSDVLGMFVVDTALFKAEADVEYTGDNEPNEDWYTGWVQNMLQTSVLDYVYRDVNDLDEDWKIKRKTQNADLSDSASDGVQPWYHQNSYVGEWGYNDLTEGSPSMQDTPTDSDNTTLVQNDTTGRLDRMEGTNYFRSWLVSIEEEDDDWLTDDIVYHKWVEWQVDWGVTLVYDNDGNWSKDTAQVTGSSRVGNSGNGDGGNPIGALDGTRANVWYQGDEGDSIVDA